MAEEGGEAFADPALCDYLVPIVVRAEGDGRVVHVQAAQPAEPELRVDAGDRLLDRKSTRLNSSH